MRINVRSSSSSSRFYYFTRGVPTGVAFLLGTLGDILPCLHKRRGLTAVNGKSIPSV